MVAAAHSHDAYEETIYGLQGVLTWTVDGVPVDVGPGDALLIPRGAVHQFDNPHEADAKALAVVTPGVLGPGYFREIAAVLAAAGGGPPDFAALGEVMRRHGLTPAG
jgi:mannose-6-phosphate isomerase-like protein (cupin superfamily)